MSRKQMLLVKGGWSQTIHIRSAPLKHLNERSIYISLLIKMLRGSRLLVSISVGGLHLSTP